MLLAASTAAADGVVTKAEAGDVAKQGREAIAEITRLVQLMEQKAGVSPLREVGRG